MTTTTKLTPIIAVLALAACGQMAGDLSSESGTGTPTQGPGTGLDPGQLTAGDWDDNLNHDLYEEYVDDYLGASSGTPIIESSDRIVVTVVNEYGWAVPNALVRIHDAESTYLTAPTATDGRLLFLPQHDGADGAEGLQITVEPPADEPEVAAVTLDAPEGDEWTVELTGSVGALPEALDLAFVIDATGSMSDEMRYIQAEIQSIVSMVAEHAETASIRLALIVYRDTTDDYVSRSFDFTDDIGAFRSNLDAQAAGGGGDYPEAMHDALGDMNQLSWRSGNVARVAFLIADAPPHDDKLGETFAEVDTARRGGIKIYPVAASGVADLAEYVMRTAAMATLARYVFLTDDSGVGGTHAEPHIPCYQVQYLNLLMGRIILSEITGGRIEPDPEEIIREAGEPVDGVCTLDDGSLAYL